VLVLMCTHAGLIIGVCDRVGSPGTKHLILSLQHLALLDMQQQPTIVLRVLCCACCDTVTKCLIHPAALPACLTCFQCIQRLLIPDIRFVFL
jgi:hypothetical protein